MPYTTQESKQNYKQKMLCKTYHVFQKKHAPSYKTYHANYHHHHYCRHRSRLHILLLLLLPATNSSQVHSSVFYIFFKEKKAKQIFGHDDNVGNVHGYYKRNGGGVLRILCGNRFGLLLFCCKVKVVKCLMNSGEGSHSF